MEPMDLQNIPINKLHPDYDFNCRGLVVPADVEDLIESIKDHGLQQPILVTPYDEKDKARTGKDFLIVAGYRRFVACKAIGYETIDCVVKPGITRHTAQVLNFAENLKRKNLNLYQEAKALEKWKIAGFTQEEIAADVKMSRSWVQVRFMLLDLPQEIQARCNEGLIKQDQVRAIYSLPREQQFIAVRKIIDKRLKGEKGIKVARPVSQNAKRCRDKPEMNLMLDHIMEHLGPSFATRTLAWAAGNISSLDLYTDIRTQMNELGKDYEIPEEDY